MHHAYSDRRHDDVLELVVVTLSILNALCKQFPRIQRLM